MGVTDGTKTVDKIFIIKMCVVKYSSATRGRLYLCFRSFVVSIAKNRSENMINYITVMS
jgi:hypothetical protein